jgi:hypothetical protein
LQDHWGLTWSDAVTVERLLFRELDTILDGLFTGLLSVEGCTESSGSLLVHLGTRGDTIDGHEEELLRFDLSKKMLDVVENTNEHFLLAKAERCVFARIFVCAVVNDTIHVELL